MKRIPVILLLAALAALLAAGCEEDDKQPYFTRFDTSGTCGVADFRVDFYAIASGGNEKPDPTGGNLYLDFEWDFGDGDRASGSSIVYHTYEIPGEYLVRVTVKDDDGDSATDTVTVWVRADTLDVWASSEPADAATTGEAVDFDVMANACGFDPDTGDYNMFIYRWFMDDDAGTTYDVRRPSHTFGAAEVGTRQVRIKVSNPAMDITRWDTLNLEISEPAGL